jgi:hypothetical protein
VIICAAFGWWDALPSKGRTDFTPTSKIENFDLAPFLYDEAGTQWLIFPEKIALECGNMC